MTRTDLQQAFMVALGRATGDYGKARVYRDGLLATLPRSGLRELAQSQGVSLADMVQQRRQARARLLAACHTLIPTEPAP
jgi:hypothetical protein